MFKSCRILNDLQAQNGSTLGDLQSELTENPDLLIILGQLGNLLNKEFARSRSAGRTQIENAVHKQRADKREQTSPLRKSSLKTSATQA
jgi:hypothetical protein